MISNTKYTPLLSIILSGICAADIPYTFSPNTKARAAEVNENFESLDARVTTTESSLQDKASATDVNSRLSNMEAQINLIDVNSESIESRIEGLENPEEPDYYPHELDGYSLKSAEIGEIIDTIEDRIFVLGAYPFREYGSGNIYRLVFPVIDEGTQYKGAFRVQHHLQPWPAALTSGLTISGYPAHFAPRTGESTSFILERGSGPATQISSRWNGQITLNVHIGETWLTVTYATIDTSFVREEAQELSHEDGPDYSDDIDTTILNDHYNTGLLNQYKNLFNYIQIEEMQP
ncbi:MAG: hypothetical protein K6L76_02940 [Agarilytica sp.]